ncbi:hypothetical protein DUHN55_36970 [Helicobacter pylori]
MAAEPSAKERAWVIFDRIVAEAAPAGAYTNPWSRHADGRLEYAPDYETLVRLLGVPLYLGVDTRTGVPALSLDVWLSYELRRAGFDADATWPRGTHPRILPMPVANLLKAVPAKERAQLNARLTRSSAVAGVTSASANILGKNYLKQVDVIMTDWATGPELLLTCTGFEDLVDRLRVFAGQRGAVSVVDTLTGPVTWGRGVREEGEDGLWRNCRADRRASRRARPRARAPGIGAHRCGVDRAAAGRS